MYFVNSDLDPGLTPVQLSRARNPFCSWKPTLTCLWNERLVRISLLLPSLSDEETEGRRDERVGYAVIRQWGSARSSLLAPGTLPAAQQ